MTTEKHSGNDAVNNGKDDAGKNGEDQDILGKRQEDLSSEELEGDARESGTD